jgi:hypothetical protein
MSFLVTSSDSKELTNAIGIENPHSYTNHLKGTLVIPPNSEVAVQSVKIQRNPMIDFAKGRQANFWFGQRLSNEEDAVESSVCSIIPQENKIEKTLGLTDFGLEFGAMVGDAYSLHPEVDTADTTDFVLPIVEATGKFNGWQYQFPQVGASETSAVPSDSTFVSLGEEEATYASGVMTAVDDNTLGTFKLEDDEGPLSLFGGEVTFDIRQANASNWTVGLARSTDLSSSHAYLANWDNRHMFEGTGDGVGATSNTFYEYCAQSYAGVIRLYHCVPRKLAEGGAASGGMLRMEEIEYYDSGNSANSSLATGSPYASSTNNFITFNIENEIVSISNGSGVLMVTANTVNASLKGFVPKPLGQTAWKLYPQIDLWAEDDTVEITKWMGRNDTTMKNNYYNNDWISHCERDVTDSNGTVYSKWTGFENAPLRLDLRDLFRPYESGTVGATIHSYMGLDSIVMEDYDSLIICGQSDRYTYDNPGQVWQPNCADILGFSPWPTAPRLTSILNSFGASFVSAEIPVTSADSSLFIRTPRLDLKSHNAGTGNPSKILYSIPRFDNSGGNTGALFFEASERLYLDCNNAQDLHITDFKVDLVKKDETFAEDLTGSTEVCFHFRKK